MKVRKRKILLEVCFIVGDIRLLGISGRQKRKEGMKKSAYFHSGYTFGMV